MMAKNIQSNICGMGWVSGLVSSRFSGRARYLNKPLFSSKDPKPARDVGVAADEVEQGHSARLVLRHEDGGGVHGRRLHSPSSAQKAAIKFFESVT